MHKQELSIGIVTFKARKELVQTLINNIRKLSGNEIDIILIINGDNEEKMDEKYRSEMLDFCAKTEKCYPFICPEFKSLPKLWNSIVIFSNTEYNLIIGDDIVYQIDVIPQILSAIDSYQYQFFTLNGGYSHFVITKKRLHQLGYFDERFLALGEEDGDILHRHIEMFSTAVPTLSINGIFNGARYDMKPLNSEIHIDNKPTINKIIREHKYVIDPQGIKGMWDTPLRRVWPDFQQYPYELFVRKNKKNMKKFQSLDVTYD